MDSQKQIEQMANFILNEAKDKAAEMEAKTLEDFNIEKLKKVQHMKEKVRQDTTKKQTQMRTQKAVEQSQAANKCRLRKAATAAAMVDKVQDDTIKKIQHLSDDSKNYGELIRDLMVEGAMMLLEEELIIRVRGQDAALAEEYFSQVEARYLKTLKVAGVPADTTSLKMKLDKEALSNNCAGGVMIYSTDMRIEVDNTLETRLKLAVSEKMPELKALLF